MQRKQRLHFCLHVMFFLQRFLGKGFYQNSPTNKEKTALWWCEDVCDIIWLFDQHSLVDDIMN